MDQSFFSKDYMRRLQEENPAEYLLYMWKLEEFVRLFPSEDAIREYCDQLGQKTENAALATLLLQVYDLLKNDGVLENVGDHTHEVSTLIEELEQFHKQLLEDKREEIYQGIHIQVLPSIIALQRKNGVQAKGEIETCLEAIYGVHKLKAANKEVYPETEEAIQKFGLLLKVLGEKRMNEQKTLEE